MIPRRQPPVFTGTSPATLLAAAAAALHAPAGDAARVQLARALRKLHAVDDVVLTDSGTSALVLALALAAGPGGCVAFPGYACVDLAAVARLLDLRVRVYDVDPATLGPDLDSVRRVLRQGVDALVVVHLFGIPVDMTEVRRLTLPAGVTLVEDAAQAAGARLGGVALGSLGDLGVLSFGRGKGVGGGGGGALLVCEAGLGSAMRDRAPIARGARGLARLVTSCAQQLLGRPALYALPSALPWLRLGEMVYHKAHAPAGISAASARLACDGLTRLDDAAARRRRRVGSLCVPSSARSRLHAIAPHADAAPGWLRLPVLAPGRPPVAALGILRGYPRTLLEQPELTPCLLPGQAPTPGAEVLRRDLLTLPTHDLVDASDLEALRAWLRLPGLVAGVPAASAPASGDTTQPGARAQTAS